MKRHDTQRNSRRILAFLLIGATVFGGYMAGKHGSGFLMDTAARAASLSAFHTLPEGGGRVIRDKITALASDDDETSDRYDLAEVPPDPTSSADNSTQSLGPDPAAPDPPADQETGLVQTSQLSVTGANLSYTNVHINNRTSSHTIDIPQILASDPAVKLERNNEPEVLIVHTHTTEAYLPNDYGYYIKGTNTRSTDTSQNVARVGDEIAKQLTAAGIGVIHDKTLHDYPSYNGSYANAEGTIRWYLEHYPSIKVVIDGHRDAITKEDETKVKPTAEINGKKAAQVMIVAGCQEGSVTGFDNWQENLKLTVRLQEAMERDYPGLARSMLFTARRYNQHLTTGSILLEIGSEANTLEEAMYSGELIGKCLVKVLS